MLRNIVLVLGGAMFASGAMALWAGSYPAAILLMIWGAMFVFGIIYERYAYKKILDRLPDGKGWTRTLERFVDPKTRRIVTVYVKPITGERAYVAETLTSPATPVEE